MARSPIHPGKILLEEFMKPHGLTAYAFGVTLGIPRARLERIVREKFGVSADTAPRVAEVFWHYARILAEPAGSRRTGNYRA